MTWIHWVVFNVPAQTKKIPEGFGKKKSIQTQFPSALEGANSWNRGSFGGACPPVGSHRYYFKLYALDAVLDLDATATRDDVLQAIKGHVVGTGELMGTYAKKKS